MKTKCGIKLALILFFLTAISAVYFLVFYNGKLTIINDNRNTGNINEEPASEKPKTKTDDKKQEAETTPQTFDWQPVVENWKGKEISKIETEKNIVALTFDGGANADGAEKILEILRKENTKATFFFTGEFIKKYPEKTKLIIESGGNIGNHSYSHPHFLELSDDEVISEIQNTEIELGKLGAQFDPLFRFPFGERDKRTMDDVSEKGYLNIRWTVDSLGWKGTSGGMTKDLVRDKILSKTTPGAIILMHLGSNPDDKTQLDSEALPEIISKLKEKGYRFVTIAEILSSNE